MSVFSSRLLRRGFPAVLALLIAAAVTPARVAPTPGGDAGLDPQPVLSADSQFPAFGDTFTLSLTGPAGGTFFLLLAFAPGEAALGAKGTLFVDAGSFVVLLSGAMPGTGQLDLPIVMPTLPGADGVLFYLQGAVKLGPDTGLSNGLTFRIEETAPAGPRRSVGVAVTPDGTKAYVTQELDDALTILDAVSDTVLGNIPVGSGPIDVAIDPDGRHAFVVNATGTTLTVIDVASDSTVAQLPVPGACRRVAFDFQAEPPRVYVTNVRDHAVLVFEETSPGTFAALPSLPLAGAQPGPLGVLPDGRLVVGNQGTLELEVIDPATPGAPPVATVALNGWPHDVEVVPSLGQVWVSMFSGVQNAVRQFDATTWAPAGQQLLNVGTDYVDIARADPFLAVVGAGSGTAVLADSTTLALLDHVQHVPSPNATPTRAAFVPSVLDGPPGKLYVVNTFRETVVSIPLAGGAPFAPGAEVAMAHSGVPRLPLFSLTPEEDGEWFFRSVEFLNGTPLNPNSMTCATCHPNGGSDNLTHGNQAPHLWDNGATGPWGWAGNKPDLGDVVLGTFNAHSEFGGTPPFGSLDLVETYLISGNPVPVSPHVLPGGALSPEAQAGQLLFEGSAGCVVCHAAPDFIPVAPQPATLPAGVGTGIAPVNVPTLRGLWLTAPYLHDGSAATLLDVLLQNVGDQHGTTSGLSASERAQLVGYLSTL